MKRTLFVTSVIFLLVWSTAWADKAVESAQQILKAGGFYYGEINGTKDAERRQPFGVTRSGMD